MKCAIICCVVASCGVGIYLNSFAILKEAQALPQLSSHEQITRALHKAVKAHNTQAVYVAVSLGADVNAYDSVTGHTPLIEAVVQGDVSMVRTLRTCGADCSKQDNKGNSMHYYVQMLHETKSRQADEIMRELHAQ